MNELRPILGQKIITWEFSAANARTETTMTLPRFENTEASDFAAPTGTQDPNNWISFYIPPEIGPLRHEFRRFVEAAIYKLRKNAHKSKWEHGDINKAFAQMQEEIEELRQAISEKNSIEILLESSDVMNFAMIIASIATEKGAP